MKRLLLAAIAIAVAALLVKPITRAIVGGDGAPGGGAAAPTNVLVITLDTTRADRIGAYGHAAARTPTLDALAREGARFDNAAAVAPITGPSHAGMFTGRYPARFAVRDNVTTPLPDNALTLAEVLAANGFATGGFIGAFVLDRPYGFAQGFTTFDSGFTRVDSGSEANAQRPGPRVVDDALRWLRDVPAGQKFFGWVHLYDPHSPYEGSYDEEIALVDRETGRLLDALRARGDFDDTLIMVVADHGEGLGDHGEDEHGVFLYDSVLRVPWIARGGGVKAGTVVAPQVRGVDLFPTVLDAFGIAAAADLDGVSVWPLLKGETRRDEPALYAESYYPKLHWGWSELRAIRADGWKAIDAPKPELYNLRDDPGELTNLYASQRALADRMIAEAARLDREMGGGADVAVQPVDRETLERLRSLGYVGAAATAATRPGERGDDPKDRIAERRGYRDAISRAIDDLRGGKPAEAATQLRDLVRRNEGAYDLHELLGDAYQALGRSTDALGEYEYAALLNPNVASPRLSAAEVHLSRGDIPGARRQLDASAKIAPASFDVALVSGRVLLAEGRLAEAIAAFEKAVAANGANPRPRRLLAETALTARRPDVAEAQFRALLAMGYQPPRTHVVLGSLAEMRRAPGEAAAHYREALRLEPGLPMALDALRRLGLQ
ncbi:MAG: sulfatase-like hydrolase/transferase [Acidobacteriota bacterium]|nr:sulfatase-like hydrolase/transferase [Acidobacteriota bacterium]